METFVYKIFYKMLGLERVLDIGGFIGESALYLSKYNKEIYCYELSKKNFEYLKTNCENQKNIEYYNAGITNSKDEYIEYLEDSDVDSTIKVQSKSKENKIRVKNINILDLLKEYNFDGLKLDIEGGEYAILKSLIDNDLFNFKKGIIEFHDLNNEFNLTYLKSFIEYIISKNYNYSLITNENKNVTVANLNLLNFCNIYFELG